MYIIKDKMEYFGACKVHLMNFNNFSKSAENIEFKDFDLNMLNFYCGLTRGNEHIKFSLQFGFALNVWYNRDKYLFPSPISNELENATDSIGVIYRLKRKQNTEK